MQLFIFWTSLFAIISFWLLGYIYIRTQDEIKQHENEYSLLQTRLEHRKKGLQAEERRLKARIKELHDQLQEMEGE